MSTYKKRYGGLVVPPLIPANVDNITIAGNGSIDYPLRGVGGSGVIAHTEAQGNVDFEPAAGFRTIGSFDFDAANTAMLQVSGHVTYFADAAPEGCEELSYEISVTTIDSDEDGTLEISGDACDVSINIFQPEAPAVGSPITWGQLKTALQDLGQTITGGPANATVLGAPPSTGEQPWTFAGSNDVCTDGAITLPFTDIVSTGGAEPPANAQSWLGTATSASVACLHPELLTARLLQDGVEVVRQQTMMKAGDNGGQLQFNDILQLSVSIESDGAPHTYAVQFAGPANVSPTVTFTMIMNALRPNP